MSTRPTKKLREPVLPVGTRVRFTAAHLGASVRSDLGRIVDASPAVGDEGMVAFAHPSPHPELRDWFYVAWSPDPQTTLYVGVTAAMVEVV